MKILLPENTVVDVRLSRANMDIALLVRAEHKGQTVGEYSLSGDSFPEIRYLIILYFYNEYIPVGGKAPHPITLEEYTELYQAIFAQRCAYRDKHNSIDHLRTHKLYQSLLKKCNLKFARGGLCSFEAGRPDEGARQRFRLELISEMEALPRAGEEEARLLKQRIQTLKGYLSTSPAMYLGIEKLMPQQLQLGDESFTLYQNSPVPWVRLIESHRFIFISGRCGSGKTTLLKCIGLDPAVNTEYKLVEKKLLFQTHLYSPGELSKLESDSHKYLYLLDGYNELPRDGRTRAVIVHEISRLAEFPNVRIIVSSQGKPAIFSRYAQGELGGLMPFGDDKQLNPIVLDTPLICNAYLNSSSLEKRQISDEYHLLEYASHVKFAALYAKASPDSAVDIRLAYSVMLPVLAERLCLNDRMYFDESDLTALFQELRTRDSQAAAVMRYSFACLDEALPSVSQWCDEKLESVFDLLIQTGEILSSKGLYSFSHQSVRDFHTAGYELTKLNMLLDGVGCNSIRTELNIGAYARTLLAQALGATSGLRFNSGSLGERVLNAISTVTSGRQLTARLIKLTNATAQFFEYLLPKKEMTLEINDYYLSVFARETDWICENIEEARLILNKMKDERIDGILSFTFCKQAEMTINYIETLPDADNSISRCIRFADCGLKLLGSCPRLAHSKAKALLYNSYLLYQRGALISVREQAQQGLAELKQCSREGSFLSSNLLAFIGRTPAPFLLKLLPDARAPVQSFILNMRTVTGGGLHGLQISYALSEVLDALFTGEVKINLFSGLATFTRLIFSDEEAQRTVSTGNRGFGQRAANLARALMEEYSEAMLNDSAMLFYRYALDRSRLVLTMSADEANTLLRQRYNSLFREALEKDLPELPVRPYRIYFFNRSLLKLLALYFLNLGLVDNTDYAGKLCQCVKGLSELIEKLACAEKDMCNVDVDHTFYVAERFIYYYEWFGSSESDQPAMKSLNREVQRLKTANQAFRRKHMS